MEGLRELKRCVGRGNQGLAVRDMSERHWQHLKSCTCDDDPYGEACGFCLCERGNYGFYNDTELRELLNTCHPNPLLEKMARALEDLSERAKRGRGWLQNGPSGSGGNWGIFDTTRAEEVLQKYLEATCK